MTRPLPALAVILVLAGCPSEPAPEYQRWLQVSPDCWTEGTEFNQGLLSNPARLRFEKEPPIALPTTAVVESFFVFDWEGDPADDGSPIPTYDRTRPVRVVVDLDWRTEGDAERAWTYVEFEHEVPDEGQRFRFNVAPNDPDFAAQHCASVDCGDDDRVLATDCQDFWDTMWLCDEKAVYRSSGTSDCLEEPGTAAP